jgi:hypothetical protein
MRPISFPQQTGIMQKPPTMTDEECSPLPVHRCVNHCAFISCWKPTWRERLALFFGKPMWVWVSGDQHPPIAIDVQNPFQDIGGPHD